MSTQPPLDLAGYNLKEWSLIILLAGLAFVFGVFGIGMAIAIAQGGAITLTGEIDLSQFTTIITGIAMVAVVLVSQQLTSKNNAAAVITAKS